MGTKMIIAGPDGIKQWEPVIDGQVTDINAWFGVNGDGLNKIAVRDLYHEVPFVKKMANLRASTVASVPWEITRNERPVFTSEDSEPPEELSYLAGMDDIRHRQSLSGMLTGASYELIDSDGAKIDGFRYMNPDTITPKYTDGRLSAFVRKVNGAPKNLDVESVMYCWPFDPWVEIGPGTPDAEGMRVPASVVRSLSIFADKYLRRGAIKNTIFVVPPGTAEDEKGRLKKLWDNLWGGTKGVGDAIVLEGDGVVTPVTIGDGVADLGNMTLTEDETKQIADAFQVPRSIALDDSANFATANRSWLTFLNGVCVPEAQKITRVWNEQVLQPQGLYMRLYPKRMEAYQAAELETSASVMNLVGRPVLTVEEGREMLGLEPNPVGELHIPTQRLPEKTLSVEAREELQQWYSKAKKNRDAEFWCYHLPPEVSGQIKDRLRVGFPLASAFEV